MTFEEYNTDKNYDDKNSSLQELVKLGVSEGKSKDDIRNSLSPKWQKSSKIGNFDNYYANFAEKKQNADDFKKVEPKKEEVTEETAIVTTPVTETKNNSTKTNSNISKGDKKYIDEVTGLANYTEDQEYEHQKEEKAKRQEALWEQIQQAKENIGNVDDKLVEQLPTFMFRRYQNGEFGDPKGTDAKLRLAHFMINNVGTSLMNASNVIKGKPLEQSDYDKYQAFNLEQGLENRWIKNKQETQHLIDMIKNQDFKEQELLNTAATISQNNRLQATFNAMNEKQKIFALKVLTEVGNEIGNLNNKDFVNTLMAMSMMGESLTWQEAAEVLGIKFGPDAIKKAGEYMNETKTDGNTEDPQNGTAGNETAGNGTGNKVTLDDGTIVDPGVIMNNSDYKKLVQEANKLTYKYDSGEISQEDYARQYGALEDLMKKHKFYNFFIASIKSTPKQIKSVNKAHQGLVLEQLEDLQNKTKREKMTYDDYIAQMQKLGNDWTEWGGDDKSKEKMTKKILSEEAFNKNQKKVKTK